MRHDQPVLVYALRDLDRGVVKIGATRDFPARLKQLQQREKRTLEIVMLERGSFVAEGRIQVALAAAHVEGEWFLWSDDLKERLPLLLADGLSVSPVSRSFSTPGLGAELKAKRKARGVTQADLATALGVTQGFISSFETEKFSCGLPFQREIEAWIVGPAGKPSKSRGPYR